MLYINRIHSNSEYFKKLLRYQNRLLPFKVQTNAQLINNNPIPLALPEQQQQQQKSVYGIDSNPQKNRNIRTLKEDNNTIFYNINSLLPLLTYIYIYIYLLISSYFSFFLIFSLFLLLSFSISSSLSSFFFFFILYIYIYIIV